MAAQYVIGASPVTFISEDSSHPGTQYQIPLPLIRYNIAESPPTGPVDLALWTQSVGKSDVPLAQALIQNLINQGVLTLSNTAAP